MPMTSGEPFLAATINPGRLLNRTAIPYVPLISASAFLTASSGLIL